MADGPMGATPPPGELVVGEQSEVTELRGSGRYVDHGTEQSSVKGEDFLSQQEVITRTHSRRPRVEYK